MECSYCQKTFHKGEHLRRHVRSHTGLKPYACKNCNRSFSRQDSLIRHERLHARDAISGVNMPDEATGRRAPSPATTRDPSNVIASTLWLGTVAAPVYNSPPSSSVSGNEHLTVSTPRLCLGLDGSQGSPTSPQNLVQNVDLDFELIWPDSEDLFHTLMSQDAALQWQIPLGNLPFSSNVPIHAENVNRSNASYATPTSLDERVSSIGSIPPGGNNQALKNIRRMIANSSSSLNAAIDGTSINSVFLDESLHMFFLKFVPTFPVLHRATFLFRDCTHPLLLNAIAIGSLYLGPKASIAKGEALWRLAHAAVATSWQALITYRGPYDACEGIQLVITALLGQIYGGLSKNRSIRTTSQATRALSFSWARRCGMFDNPAYSNEDLLLDDLSEAEKDHQWRKWVGQQIQYRVLLGLYVVDGCLAQMAGEPTSVRHAANQLGLLGSDKAFEATTADTWTSCMQQEPQNHVKTSFRNVLNNLFSPHLSLPAMNLSAFSLRVILEGLQSILSECASDTGNIIGVPSKSEVRSALSRIHATITQSTSMSTDDRLETLLRWHGICLEATVDTSTLCRELCTRWNVEQHIWTGSSSQRAVRGAQWATSEDARRALLHAVASQDIVETLPRGRAHAIHMPASLFAASTIYAAFALSEVVNVNVVDQVDWRMVLDDTYDNDVAVWDTKRFIQGDGAYHGSTRNMVYELNSMHKLMGCLKTQWGLASDMEEVVERWVELCH